MYLFFLVSEHISKAQANHLCFLRVNCSSFWLKNLRTFPNACYSVRQQKCWLRVGAIIWVFCPSRAWMQKYFVHNKLEDVFFPTTTETKKKKKKEDQMPLALPLSFATNGDYATHLFILWYCFKDRLLVKRNTVPLRCTLPKLTAWAGISSEFQCMSWLCRNNKS